MTGINEVAKQIHENAVDHGWWDEERGFPEVLALIHSEVSEALEEYRNGRLPTEVYAGNNGKPEGIPIELADVIIRVLDYCGYAEIDIDTAISQKHEYNKSRPYRHGGKKCFTYYIISFLKNHRCCESSKYLAKSLREARFTRLVEYLAKLPSSKLRTKLEKTSLSGISPLMPTSKAKLCRCSLHSYGLLKGIPRTSACMPFSKSAFAAYCP